MKHKVIVDIETDVLDVHFHTNPKSYMVFIHKGKYYTEKEYKLEQRKIRIEKILNNETQSNS